MNKKYSKRLAFGEIREDIIEDFINTFSKYKGVKYISYDKDGNITWQQIETRYGNKRHPDFLVNNKKTKELAILIEVKSLTDEYYNLSDNIEILENESEPFLTAEKAKIDDYEYVQSHYEIPCKIVFVIGRDNEEKRFYWETLDYLTQNISYEGRPYGKDSPVCYMWRANSLHWGLDGLLR